MKQYIQKPTLLLIMAVSIFAASCSSKKEEKTVKEKIDARVQKAKLTPLPDPYVFSGKIIADDKSSISTKVMGRITSVNVNEGQAVKKGQLLITIDSQDILAKKARTVASFEEAQAAYNQADKSFERMKALKEKGSVTSSEFDQAEAAYRMAEARVQAARQSIREVNELMDYTNIKAPMSGTVSMKHVNEGDMARPGAPLLTLESTTNLLAEIYVPEYEISNIKEGNTVDLRIDALYGQSKIKGNILQIIPSTETSGSQYRVKIQPEKLPGAAKAGMFVRTTFYKGTQDRVLIPESAIYRKGQLTGLFVVSDKDQALLRWVRLGKTYDNGTEVLSGLSEGEVFVTEPNAHIVDGIFVNIQKEPKS